MLRSTAGLASSEPLEQTRYSYSSPMSRTYPRWCFTGGTSRAAQRTEWLVYALAQLAGAYVDHASDFQGLSWDIHYDNVVCQNLKAGNIAALTRLLPEMVNPHFDNRRRSALYDVLLRREQELYAVRDWIAVAGSASQYSDAQHFFELRQIFIDNFPHVTPDPNVIQAISNLLGQVAQDFNGLVEVIDDITRHPWWANP